MTTLYRLVREEPDLFQVIYRAHGRLYCLRNDGGYGRSSLNFYQCTPEGEPMHALTIIPDPDEFDDYREP